MKYIVLILSLIILISCNSEKKLQIIEGSTMGTYYRVTLYTSENPSDVKEEIDRFLKLFNNVFSTYIPDSEISRINNNEYAEVKVTDTMKKVLELSLDISRKSKGYFDVTVAPIVNAWGFGPSGKITDIPSDAVLDDLKRNIGYHKLKFKDNLLYRENKNVRIDLSAIAKGFGVDELTKFLEFKGHGNLLVDIGGEVRARGKKADGSLWKVGIEGPSEDLGTSIIQVIKLNNMAMATSGNYRNFVKFGDAVFGHTIDPITGKPAEHKTISVSIIAEYCADADAWATALMSMGVEKGLELANQNDIKALFQVKKGQAIEIIKSRHFEKFIKNNQ